MVAATSLKQKARVYASLLFCQMGTVLLLRGMVATFDSLLLSIFAMITTYRHVDREGLSEDR